MKNEICLSNANLNCFYEICGVNSHGKIETRLYDLGFIEKEIVRVTKKSIFGGVFLVEIMGGELAVKKKELEKIWVRKI